MFDEKTVLDRLKQHLPLQAPLKDFVLQNPLKAFQNYHFDEATNRASIIFGYKTTLNIEEYRALYKENKIREDVLERVIIDRVGEDNADEWLHNLFTKEYNKSIDSRVGHFRIWWKKTYGIDLDHEINNVLFRLLGGYLDQGVAQWHFPFHEDGFLASVRELEQFSVADFIRTKDGLRLLLDESLTIKDLLDILIDGEELYENYLFDQQFSHPGWSGLIAQIESKPSSLLDYRPISLSDVIKFELILEIDTLYRHHGKSWKPFSHHKEHAYHSIFEPTPLTIEAEANSIWQQAYEWSYYDSVLAGIQKMKGNSHQKQDKTFQAMFCIDDREGSLRRYIEIEDPTSETYGTPGHFGLEILFQPKNSEFTTKTCPAPATPKYLIRETGKPNKKKSELHFAPFLNHPVWSIPSSVVLGFYSGYQMLKNVFNPQQNILSSSSFGHMDQDSIIQYEYKNEEYNGIPIGLTVDQMTTVVRNVLESIGLVNGFGHLVYAIGHGASSINNPFYAEYDCGACSSRPGSVNARIFAMMANREDVRKNLIEHGIDIPSTTQFVGGLHDTTNDVIEFFDEDVLSLDNSVEHKKNKKVIDRALARNAKERSRCFFSTNTNDEAENVHKEVKKRSVSLFEPRAELGHMNNSLCIVGRHSLHEGLYLDRRAFSNSYDYSLDKTGALLLNILRAAVPVCGGINLQYLFSTTDPQKIGSGSKLPHNIMGLIGVTNGVEGDIRPGLALQMIESHTPIRLMMIVEHFPDVVWNVLQQDAGMYEWIKNFWIQFAVINPETSETYRYTNSGFEKYTPLKKLLDTAENLDKIVESNEKQLPIYLIKK